jgi:hypothetical protein
MGVAQRLEFRHDDPTLDEIHHLLPKLLEYYHKPESGLNDPILRALHEKIDPGTTWLSRPDNR